MASFFLNQFCTFIFQLKIMNLANIKILHIDSNHPLLWEQLQQTGFHNEADFTSSKQEVEGKIENYHGIVIRSRFKID